MMLTILVLALLCGIMVLLAFLFRPVPVINPLNFRPHPARSYSEALDRLGELSRSENSLPLHDDCPVRLLAHSQPTEHVALLLHGYTNCPEQLGRLAERFYARGYNVLAPRMPYHGYADRLTDELEQLTAEDMIEYASTALDIACGLGKRVTVFGFSAGGSLALWLAQNRPEVDTVVTLSAFLGIGILPDRLHRPFINLFLRLPNFFVWWDPRDKEASPYSVEYSYPRFSLRNLAQMLRIGASVEASSRQQPPAAVRAVFLVNESDPGVSNRRLLDLAGSWRSSQQATMNQADPDRVQVSVDCFRATSTPVHDVVTPGMPGAPVERIYDRIMRLALLAGEPEKVVSP